MSLELVFEHENLTKRLNSLKIDEIYDKVLDHGISLDSFYLTVNGLPLNPHENLRDGSTVRVKLRLLGGKGGFGSMLRAIGAQIEKTTNREACRDLSGRRLRDINEEKRLKAWLEKQKIEPESPDEKFKKKIGKLLAKPKHEFKDDNYMQERTTLTERVDEAVEQGFKKAQEIEASRGVKRANVDEKGNPKKAKGAIWTGLEDGSSGGEDDSSDSDTEDEEEFSPEDPTMKKIIELYMKDREKELTKDDEGTSSDSKDA
ncbi:splicing regulator SDE2 [Culicoides brevitarsis]|uniref:splicing regulator SDE2 n=1 Tax=Culicoides brevitarsis TaxID=469753 RepID=UPI00307C017A